MSEKYPAIKYSKYETSFIDDEFVSEDELSSGKALRNGVLFKVSILVHEKNGVSRKYAFIHIDGEEEDFRFLIDELNPCSIDGTIF
ncbi:hypothetical protein [Enterobacter hormaechei]|uniref:hypothetical protein n=1 Tax=Enterobacter hormaechei TaxID=158836 RepID=UPI0012571A4C|nr:hypothetical protein [Enterobacter hormaechei]VAK71381.1 Uncharacterised protein [Enterobacter hormaechei]